MVIDAESAFQAVAIVLKNDEANKTIKGSLQSGLVAALGSFVGSMAGGPKGVLPGAVVGACAAYYMTKDSYKSILDVIRNDLSGQERAALIRNVRKVISSFNVVDIAVLMTMASQNESFQKEILRCVHAVVDSHISKTSSAVNYDI